MRECCIRGYHIYKAIWMAAIREILNCQVIYAIAVIKDETITGHLPRKVSRFCSLLAKEIVAEGMESEPLGVHL